VNLMENAARYTPPGSQITINAMLEPSNCRVVVADNGPGIPSGAEERIFEKFYRAPHRADSGQGSGLGLAICRAIIKSHGGSITVANRSTGGAEFVIRLPLSKNSPTVNLT
jgi:two-component system, OmpR family, sensor histidine kinase KdpD